MALDLLDLEYQYVNVNVMDGDTRTTEYLSLNPQHTVPVLVDGKLVITESRAALTYLVSQHRPGALYPTEPAVRAKIDQRLYFNIGTLYKRLGDCVYPVCLGQTNIVEKENIEALKEALAWVNDMVADGFVINKSMTIADIDFLATISSLEACKFIDLCEYKNLKIWSKKMKEIIPKYHETCGKGAESFGKWFNSNYSKNEKFKNKIRKSLGKGFINCF